MDKEKQYKYYSSSYNESIFNLVPKNKKVLDMGCNTGNLGERLIKDKNCIVYGLDYSKLAIKEAKKKLNKALVLDLENYTIPFKQEKFDIIVFADVLEHLRYPERILKNYLNILKPDGKIIISIPNIAYIKIRVGLLFGRWNYKKAGILDRTHLRFFTKKTIINLLKYCGYKIIYISPALNKTLLRDILRKLWPELFTVQFTIVAKSSIIK